MSNVFFFLFDLSITAVGQEPGTIVPETEFRDAMSHFAIAITVFTSFVD